MEDQQQAQSQSASVPRLDDTQSDDAQSVDARFFVAQAKSALSPEQYEQFVGILQDLRDSSATFAFSPTAYEKYSPARTCTAPF